MPSWLLRVRDALMNALTPTRLALLVIALSWLYVFPYSAKLNNPNERTRVLQARAMVEEGVLHVGETFEKGRAKRLWVRDHYQKDHRRQFVNDLALVCEDPELEPPKCVGKLYPAKAPGAALMGWPALKLAYALGVAEEGPEEEAKVTWLLRYGGVALPMLFSLWVVGLLLRRARVDERIIAKVILAGGLGTALFPYSVMFVGHALAGAGIIVGVYTLERARTDRWPHLWAALGGAATSAAVLMEYHAALMVAMIGLWTLLSRDRWRLIFGFAAGALAMFVVHALLHQAMFGSPFKTGHFHLMSAHNREGQSSGFLGIDGFHFAALVDVMLDPYMGLLPLMPWLVVGSWRGVPALLKGLEVEPEAEEREKTRAPLLSPGAGRALAATVLIYLLFVSMLGQWRTMNGWSIGPRYLVPAMMPALVLAGVGWQRLADQPFKAGLIRGLAAASMIIVAAITVVFPQPPAYIHNPFVELAVPLLDEGIGVRNLGLYFGWGEASLKPFFWILLLAAGWLVFAPKRAPKAPPEWRRAALSFVLALVVAIGWVKLMPRWPTTKDPKRVEKGQNFVRDVAEGWHPEREASFFPKK